MRSARFEIAGLYFLWCGRPACIAFTTEDARRFPGAYAMQAGRPHHKKYRPAEAGHYERRHHAEPESQPVARIGTGEPECVGGRQVARGLEVAEILLRDRVGQDREPPADVGEQIP
jgi:hypothetical protein